MAARINRIADMVREIQRTDDPNAQLKKIAAFNSVSSESLSEPEKRTYDQSIPVIQRLSQAALKESKREKRPSFADRTFYCVRNYVFPCVVKVVRFVGGRNLLISGVVGSSYLYAGKSGVFFVGSCLVTGRVLSEYFRSKFSERKVMREPVNNRSFPKPIACNREPLLVHLSESPAAVQASIVCPLSGKKIEEIPEDRRIILHGKTYDRSFLIVALILKDNFPVDNIGPDEREIAYSELSNLISYFNITKDAWNKIWRPSGDTGTVKSKRERLTGLLKLVEKSYSEKDKSEKYCMLLDPVIKARAQLHN